MSARLPDWEARLTAAVAKHVALPSQYGVSDCFLVFWDGAAAVIGADAMPWPRPAGYKSARGALRKIRSYGFADVGEGMAAAFPSVAPSLAQRGDGGIVRRDGLVAAGVFTGQGFLTRGETGPVFLGASAVAMAFRVGR